MAHAISQGDGPDMFTLSGEFDMAAAAALAAAFGDNPGVLELDASAVDFIDSHGLHAIVDALGASGSYFVNPSDAVVRFLALVDQSGMRAGIDCR